MESSGPIGMRKCAGPTDDVQRCQPECFLVLGDGLEGLVGPSVDACRYVPSNCQVGHYINVVAEWSEP